MHKDDPTNPGWPSRGGNADNASTGDPGIALPELPANILRLIDATTEGQVKAISFDLDVDADNLKYSSWISALAMGGLGLIVANYSKLAPEGSTLFTAMVGPISAAVALAGAIALGAYLNWMINKSFLRKRQTMTLYLKQKCLLLAGEANDDPFAPELRRRITGGVFLSKANQDHLEEFGKDDAKAPNVANYILAQGVFAACGYGLALVAAARLSL